MPIDNAPETERLALVRRPSPRLADGLITYIERLRVDAEVAQTQWRAYVDALAANGWRTIEVPPADDCPDAAFVEDTAVVFNGVAVIANPGADARKPETEGTAATLQDLGYRIMAITKGSLDGGDVLKIGSRVYVGCGGRTDPAGLAEFRSIVEPLGGNVIAVSHSKVLHLKSAVTALPDGSLIGYPPLVDDPTFFPHFRPVPEPGGSYVVDLGGGRLLMAASAPRSADLFADLGYTPVPVDISEFEKMEGCVTCLSIRLRCAPALERTN
jgi:dimethylargininase